jgi:hypothetical protein
VRPRPLTEYQHLVERPTNHGQANQANNTDERHRTDGTS